LDFRAGKECLRLTEDNRLARYRYHRGSLRAL
jgi:hypothetical protein